MISLVVALLLTAEPLIVVAPFQVNGGGPADANLGCAFASLVELVLEELHKPLPAGFTELKIEDALMRAWREALAEGDPAAAKRKVADVVKRWPAFTPAKDRLAQL